MKTSHLRHVFLRTTLGILCFVLANAAITFAQAGRGAISGLVADTSGGVMPGVTIEALNPSTGAVFQTVTTGAGLYSFISLAPASYQVTARHEGFETSVHKKVVVTVDQTTTLNITLRPGAFTQEITVTGTAPLAETSNSTVGQLITSDAIDRVPLLTRDEYELVQLSAGVIATNGTPNAADTAGIFNERPGADVSGYTINGALQGSTYYSLDGSPIQIGENNLGAFIPAWQIPLDAIEEYRVETQNIPASYQAGGSGVISLATKAGTNQFHGDAFGYFRPNAFSSNDAFVKASQLEAGQPNQPPNFHRYQEGGSIGGPIRHDKLFFFGDYEATQQASLQTGTFTVPTASELTGDFSADSFTIYDPLVPDLPDGTRQPFPGNKIPSTDLNPVALNIAALSPWPSPNQAGIGPWHVDNYYKSALQPNNAQKFDVRMDFNRSEKQHFFSRFSFDRAKFGDADLFGASNIYDPSFYQNITNGRNIMLADDYTLSANTMLQLRYSFTRHYEDQTGDPRQIGFNITSVGFPASLAAQQVYRDIPFIDFYGPTANLGSNPWTTFLMASMVHDALATLTTTKGKHSLSLGFEFQKQLMNEGQPVAPSGWYSFDATATSSSTWAYDGSDFASFLLGMGSYPGGEYDNFTKDIFGAQANPYYGLFIQDTYRIRRNLTLSLGLRWDIFGGRTERYDRQEYFDPTIQYTVAGVPLTGGEQFEHPGIGPFTTNLSNFSPRFGIAYQPLQRLVIRGGFGIYYGPSTQMVGNNALNTDGFYPATTWNATTYNADGNTVMLNSLSNPFPYGVVQATGSSLGPATNIGVGLDTELHSQPTPAVYDYNFGIEYQFPHDYVLSVAWVGSHGLYLPLAFGASFNQLPLSTIGQYQSALNNMVPNTWEATQPVVSAWYGQPTVPLYVALEPYPQFNGCGAPNCGVGVYDDPAGYSSYNSLQIKLQKRLTHHFTTLAAFTWGKLLTNNTSPPLAFIGQHGAEAYQDWQNMNLEYSLSPQDLSYAFSWQASYDLPLGRDRLIPVKGWANKILGGWTLNTILYLNSGIPIATPFDGTDIYLSQRVNMTCNPASGAPHTAAEWFNYSCFSQPSNPYLPGTAPPFITGLRTDGGRNLDASLFKNIKIGEHKTLQFQFAAYNVTNFVQLGYPNVFWNPTPNPTTMAGFGLITNDLNTPRQLQFAARFTF